MFVLIVYDVLLDLRVGLNFYERWKMFLFVGFLSIIYGFNLRVDIFLLMICYWIRDRGLNSYLNICCVIKINVILCWEGLYFLMYIYVCKNFSFVCLGVDFFFLIYYIIRCKFFYVIDICYIFIDIFI